MAKSIYNCILYEPRDKVQERYGTNEILEIESTDLKYIGIYPTQFLKFKDKPVDIGHFSNLFIPAAETIEKYKDGLKYFDEVKVKSKEKSDSIKKGTKIHEKLARQLLRANKNILNEEDLKPKIVAPGTFSKLNNKSL